PADETSRVYLCPNGSEASRRAETPREIASQSSSVAGSPLAFSRTRRRTEYRPAPALSTASRRHPFSAERARISPVVSSLSFISCPAEQKSGLAARSFQIQIAGCFLSD